jgi:hypothetical protein
MSSKSSLPRIKTVLRLSLAALVVLHSDAADSTTSITTSLHNKRNHDHIHLSTHDFNNYVDTTFTCPVLISCPQVCVASNTSCPTRCDPNLDQVLCLDGSCQTTCPTDLVNPCAELAPCASKACPQKVQFQWACQTQYGSYYELEQQCRESIDNLQEARKNRYSSPLLSALALFWVLLTLSVWVWNWKTHGGSNHDQSDATAAVYSPQTTTEEEDEATTNSRPTTMLTGYTSSCIGTILYASVVSMMVALQVLLCGLAVASYGAQHTQSETLLVFEIVWSLGFVYTLAFQYPYSVRSLFWKPCQLQEARHVCIVTSSSSPGPWLVPSKRDPVYMQRLRALSARLTRVVHRGMSKFFFLAGASAGHRLAYVPVQKDAKGTHYFVHEFRRFNYNAETQGFDAGNVPVMETLGDVLDSIQQGGLTSLEVERRLRMVGPNSIEMRAPDFGRALADEFSKSFYVYQLFMLWSWVPLYYFYLGVIHGTAIVAGGFTIAWFKFRNERNHFKLTHVEGDVDCLRDGSIQSVPQAELVPGDLVQVASGKVYSDMILVQTEGLLVDESALTGESTPMSKRAVDPNDRDVKYNPLTHKKHTISAGTTIVESEVKNNLAVVLKTSSYTSKGELLREVFSYERHQFKFDVEVGYVLFLLFIEAIIGFVLVTQFLGDQPVYSWFYGM